MRARGEVAEVVDGEKMNRTSGVHRIACRPLKPWWASTDAGSAHAGGLENTDGNESEQRPEQTSSRPSFGPILPVLLLAMSLTRYDARVTLCIPNGIR